MAHALHLAARALGSSSPNPAVGAVVVRSGRIAGEGWTQRPGAPHAEVMALDRAGAQARDAVLYVTLEPCSHQGRTPPCTEAIVAAGIRQVHLAMIDPSPWVNGQGQAMLERAGITTILGSHEAEAQRLNEAYLTWVSVGRPFVTAVYAISLDGAICNDLVSAALSELARAELDALRKRADRAIAGTGTLLQDDPGFTRLGAEGVTSLVVECGAADLAALIDSELVDKVVALATPCFARPFGAASSGRGSAIPIKEVTYERLGDTLMAVGYLKSCSVDS